MLDGFVDSSDFGILGISGKVGAVTYFKRYEYDAYGEVKILDASYNSRGSSNYRNPYYFTGRRVVFLDNGDMTLQFNRNRYYSQSMGRWLTPDPLGITPNADKKINPFAPKKQYTDGLSFYEYVKSNPVIGIDSYGLELSFRWYGNWGGPGWTGGYWTGPGNPWPNLENLPPNFPFKDPIDAYDACYKDHDICYSDCRGLECDRDINRCNRRCNRELADCLWKTKLPGFTPLEDLQTLITIPVFKFF